MKRGKNILKRLQHHGWVSFLLQLICGGITCVICFLMLEYSSGTGMMHLDTMRYRYIVLNIATTGILWSVLMLLTNRSWIACMVCSLLCGMLAIVNHYVLIYHGMPMSFLVLKNFTTAMNVASAYSFSPDRIVYLELLAMAALVVMSLLLRAMTVEKNLRSWRRGVCNGLLAAASFGILWIGYYSEQPIKPKQTISWLWSEAYHTYGYAACTVESLAQSIRMIDMPQGYSEEAADAIPIVRETEGAQMTPDIVLILNETFYDLGQITDLETDVPYMQNIDAMDNVLRGYAVVPANGGGTNNSEYELLTSNSLELMPGITPFNSLDLYKANSVISHMRALGYYTFGAHSEPAVNYSRGLAYTALGMDEIHFDGEFLNKDYYYSRWFESDKCLYENLIGWYEQMPQELPRFQYLLTIQNHGEWNMNDPEHDIVHALGDYGDAEQQVNEFLTCMYLSDEAFKTLTDYYASVERPVIVCMLGDHAPNFASSIVDERYSKVERELLLRKVPLLIWANFELPEADLGMMSLNYVIPTLLKTAGVSLNPYYSYLLWAKERVPVITAYGSYFDHQGNHYTYREDDGTAYAQVVDDYFYLEYRNLHSMRGEGLFEPYQ